MISVVVPTYNEQANVRSLLTRVCDSLSAADLEFEIIVVDDDSPDGTAQLAAEVGNELPHTVRVIVRTDDPDLSRSVVRGFREAKGETVVVMDADLQHPPEVIPELVTRISPETPIAVGTRYSHGGRIENWSLSRQIVSYGALLLAKLFVPPARGVSDPISGFFAVRADSIRPSDLNPRGYKILIEILASVEPDHVAEVGFTFESRERGKTSLNASQYVRYLRHVVTCGIGYYRRDRDNKHR